MVLEGLRAGSVEVARQIDELTYMVVVHLCNSELVASAIYCSRMFSVI